MPIGTLPITNTTINGNILTLTFNVILDQNNLPGDDSVVITVGGKTALVSSGFASSNQLVLTLDTVMQPGAVVTFAYVDPTSANDAKAFQDSAGNDIGSFNVAAFIASSRDSGTLFDINNDGSFDWMQLVETWTDQQGIVQHDDAVYRVVAGSGDSYTAQHYIQFTFGSTYDANDRPLSFLDDGNDCAITWQERDSDGVVATAPISFYMEVNGVDTKIDGTFKFIDANNNGKPDQLEVVYPNSANPSQYLSFASGDITDYTYNLADRPISFGVVLMEEAGGSSDLFNFTLTGGVAAPTAISLPSDEFDVDNQQPYFQYARVDGNQFTLTYNELLDSAHLPAATAFAVRVNGTVVGISNVAVVENKVVLMLNTYVASGASVTFSYTDPTSGNDLYALQDINGNDASSQSGSGGGGGSTDTMPPVLQSAVVNGQLLTMTFNENLGPAPQSSAFTVRVNGSQVTVPGISVYNAIMTLTLATAVQAGQTVTVSYTDPTTGNDVSALQDYTGNDAAGFTGYGVTNNTGSGSNVPWVTNVYAENESTPDNHDSAVLRVTDSIVTYVEMSSAVTVTGAPRLALLTGSTTHSVYATYDALSSTSTRLAFHYDLQNEDLGQLAVSAFDFTNGSSIATISGSVQTAINRNLQPDSWVYGASVANGTSGNDVVAISIPVASTVEAIRTALSGISYGGGDRDVLELNFVASSDNAKMSGSDSADRIDGTIDGYSVAIVKESNNINFYRADQLVKTLYSSVNGGFERLVINLLNAQGSVLESSGDIRLSSGFFSGLLGGSHYFGSEFSDTITVQSDASSWHYIETNNGNDTVIGSSGNDTCNISGDGNKSISLGDGNDVINWWSAGNSTIDGGAGSDDLYVSLDTSSGALSWSLEDDGEVHVYSGSEEITTIQNAGTSYLFTASSNHGAQVGDMVAKVSNVEYCTFVDADERTGKLILADVFAGGGTTDTTLPTLISATPSDNAVSVPVGSNMTFTFSEAIQRGSGTIEIHTGSVTGSLVDASLTLIGNTLTINPNNELANGTHYFVTLSDGSIKDLAGNPYVGTTAYDFTTVGAVPHNSSTFLSGGGIVATDFGGRDFGKSIVLQSDGKIVVVGESSGGGDGGFAVVRYNTDGSLDATFDGDGKVTTDFGGLEYATSAALQSDGKIVVAGYNGISSSGGGDFALVRYNTDGSLDTTFDGDGKVTTNLGGWDKAESVTVESDGKIVVAGYTGISSSGGGDFAVVRYNSNGTLDTSFGANGKVITNVGVEDYVHSLIVQSDHKIVVTGESGISSSGGSDFALVRYNADGTLDSTFGEAGKVLTDFDLGDYVGGAAVQPDGKIVVVGESFSSADMAVSGGQDFVIVRYNTDGTLDTSFDSDGKIVADFGGSDSAHSVTLQSDGKIVVTGSSSPAGGSGSGDGDIVVRYHTDGTLDTTFSEDGFVITLIGDESEANSVVVQPDGRILVAGQSNGDFSLVRYNSNGSIGLGIDFDGTPVGSPSSYESFNDYFLDITKQSLSGYIASVEDDDGAGTYLSDGNSDGIPDSYTHIHSDPSRENEVGTITWTANGIWLAHANSGLNENNRADSYGRLAYDAQGDIVGLYSLDINPVFELTPDTTTGDVLVATFTAYDNDDNDTKTWQLLDTNGDNVIDSVKRVGDSHSDYDMVWTDSTHFTAYRYLGMGFGSTFDSQNRPTTIPYYTPGATEQDPDVRNDIPIVWQAKGSDNVIATFSFTSSTNTGSGKLFDTNSDNIPDKISFTETDNGVSYTTMATLIGWSNLSSTTPDAVTGRVLSSNNPDDMFIGSIDGTQSAPTRIYMPSYYMGSSGVEVLSDTTSPTLMLSTPADDAVRVLVSSNIVLTFSEAVQAGTGNIVISAGKDIRTIAVTDSSQVTISGDTLTINPTSDLAPSTNYFVTISNGSVKDLAGNVFVGFSSATVFDFGTISTINTVPTFMIGDGKVTTDCGGDDYGSSVTMQRDGKILVAGYNDDDFVIVRYNSGGSLDTSFDTDGKVTTDFGSYWEDGSGVTVQSDGKILVAGCANNEFALVRYNSDGSLDTSFDTDGKVTTNFDSGYGFDFGNSVTVQSDGKILVAGDTYSQDTDIRNFALARYNSDGTLDTSFDTDGKVTTDFGGHDSGRSVTVQSDGKILVAGYSYNGNNDDFALVRYNSDGSLDTSFDTDGKVTTDFTSSYDSGNSVTVQSDGKILVAGDTYTGDIHVFAVARYNSDGSLDTSFDADGKVITGFGSDYDSGNSVTVQSDGKILVAGYSDNGNNDDFTLVRYNSDGSLDTSFDADGKVTTDFGSDNDSGNSVTVQSDGKILVAGYSDNGNNGDFALVRYNSDGSLDQAFNPHINTLDGTPAYITKAAAVVLDNNVQIFDAELSAQGHYGGAILTLARHEGASADDYFSGAGIIASAASGLVTIAGTDVGHYTWLDGTLQLIFNANATHSLVNQTVQSLAYENVSDTPPSSAQIDWTFSDSGSVEALSAIGCTTVSITAVDDPADISGNITFWKTAAPIADVTSTLTSSSASEIPSANVTDSLAGLYQHLDMADGTYALTNVKLSGTAESNAINANDALAALKIAVGMNPNADGSPVSSYQFLAADVNHDGQVKAADALNILKMAVKLSTAPEKEWLFVPESVGSETMSRTHVVWPDSMIPVTLDVDQELHLIGIVKGDVNGSWVG